MSTPIETEVKIRFAGNAGEAYKLIEGLGYRICIPRTYETDQLFDHTDGSLRASDQVLRIRKEQKAEGIRCILTYKGPADRERYKSREEIETGVTDGDHLFLILSRLGYKGGFRYEKYRTTFGTGQQPGIITVDETPLGVFLELEGAKEWIDHTATHLGFSATDYVISSYPKLWKEYLRGQSNASPDMVFLDDSPGPQTKYP
jgi:adenylate cyclase, class 2